jgi:hypothetical protein
MRDAPYNSEANPNTPSPSSQRLSTAEGLVKLDKREASRAPAAHGSLTVIPAKAEIQCLWLFIHVAATWLACRGLPTSCRRPGHFSLFGHARAGARANSAAGPKGGGQDARSKEK